MLLVVLVIMQPFVERVLSNLLFLHIALLTLSVWMNFRGFLWVSMLDLFTLVFKIGDFF